MALVDLHCMAFDTKKEYSEQIHYCCKISSSAHLLIIMYPSPAGIQSDV
jgi:hypothetical protein